MFNFIIYLGVSLLALAPSYGTQLIPTHGSCTNVAGNFAKPITFTQPGVHYFIKQIYNHADYADFLAHNMYHITQFLKNMPTDPCPILRMFGDKFKQTSYINPYAFADFLREITPLLKATVSPGKQNSLKKQISKTMYDQMLYKFDYLKQDPHAYFNELTDNLITLMHQSPITDMQKLEISKTVVAFLEITLNKLVWHPQEYKNAWTNLLDIADQLNSINEGLLHNNEDLNSLFITLLERFYLFLDLSYAEIPIDFYLNLRKQITEQPPLVLTFTNDTRNCNGLHISSDCFQTKLQRFEKIVTLAEAKTRAYNEGIYAQHYIPPWK